MKDLEPLLKLARQAIESRFSREDVNVSKEIKKQFSKDGACFVTLTINRRLRGCIGSLEARQPLYQDVIDNAINATFGDPRFLPLNFQELKNIKIEVSVLSKPEKLKYKNVEDLLGKINKNMGIILTKGFFSATFLPQVWEQISDKESFLEELSLKAGLSADSWKTAEIEFYRVEKVEED